MPLDGKRKAGRIELPEKLVPVFSGDALYRGAYGGRGSGKTRNFATMAAVHGLRCAQQGQPGVIVCGREFQNSLDDSSMAEVKAAIEAEPWLRANYELGEKYIRTRDGKIDFVFVGLRRNIESVKSTSRIRLLWVDEAEQVSEVAWMKAIPTVREDGSEIWVTWNPERRASATNRRFRENPPDNSQIIELNWRDNPFFPAVLEQIRAEDQQKRPEQYEHIWEGAYATAHAGAYYATALAEAQREGRIGKVQKDPLLSVRAYCDLGGTGARSDAYAMWICQFIGREIRVLDYYEAVGQPLGVHIDWLREHGWGKAASTFLMTAPPLTGCWMFRSKVRFAARGSWLRSFRTRAAAPRRRGSRPPGGCFRAFGLTQTTTEAGRDALGWYHEKRSEDVRDVGLGPDHDWSSHSARRLWADVRGV